MKGIGAIVLELSEEEQLAWVTNDAAQLAGIMAEVRIFFARSDLVKATRQYGVAFIHLQEAYKALETALQETNLE